jgi:hypothetical protein
MPLSISDIPVTVDGVEYFGKDLPPEGQQMLRHVASLRDQRSELEFRLEQLDVAEHGFTIGLQDVVRKSRKEAS